MNIGTEGAVPFQTATKLDNLTIIDIYGVKKFLNSAGSFERLVKHAWSRLVKNEKLGIAELLVCLLVTHATMMSIVVICTTQNKADNKSERCYLAYMNVFQK